MKTFVVKRSYGPNKDYLHAWDKNWGTACMGSPKLAMTFPTLEEAQKAAERARMSCLDVNRQPTKTCTFEAVEILI